jgi:transcriptional regulator with XRE-family HTH domain
VRVGRAVRQLRKQLGYSQETFAAACGVHRTFVGAVERAEVNVTLASLERLASGLEVDVARLFAEPAAVDAEPNATNTVAPGRARAAPPHRQGGMFDAQ